MGHGAAAPPADDEPLLSGFEKKNRACWIRNRSLKTTRTATALESQGTGIQREAWMAVCLVCIGMTGVGAGVWCGVVWLCFVFTVTAVV